MGEIVHTSISKIVREEGPTRRAVIEGFPGEVHYGVHGGIKDFYRIEPRTEYPATLDHMITAIGAWMMGTLAGVLAKSKIETPEDRYRAEVKGDIENVDGVLKITRILVNYHLKVPRGKADDARNALDVYLKRCPAAQSVIGCIDIRHDATIEEV